MLNIQTLPLAGITPEVLMQALQQLIRQRLPLTPSKSLQEVTIELLAVKASANRSKKYIGSLRQYLSLFARGQQDRPISEIKPEDIDAWFTSRKECPISRRSNLGRLSALFGFAARRGYVRENICDRVEHVAVDYKPPIILTVEQSEKLLTTCREKTPDMLPFITLGLFCGLRPSEIEALNWSAVDMKRGLVTVTVSKVRRRRVVTIPENALEWLKLCDREKPLCPKRMTLRRRRRTLADAAGFQLPQDCLRHTAASYMLARDNDAGKVAMQLGNSPKILLTHYHELVSCGDAERFFFILP